jgi:hypothetical protein
LGPKFGPIPNWKSTTIFPISDLKIPIHYQNYKKKGKKKKRKTDIITQERLTKIISNRVISRMPRKEALCFYMITI